jgi:hypothetical protein
MNRIPRRGWLAALLAVFLLLVVVWVVAVLQLSPAAAGERRLGVALRSGLAADYSGETVSRVVRALRISVVEDLMRDLGMSDEEADEAAQAVKASMDLPVPTATARDFSGEHPHTATPTKTPLPTATALPTKTLTPRPTRTPEPTKTDKPKKKPTKTPTPAGGADIHDPEIEPSGYDLDPSPGVLPDCEVEWEIANLEVFDPAPSSGIDFVILKYKVDGYSDWEYSDPLSKTCGGFDVDGNWDACYDGTLDLHICSGSFADENDGPDDFEILLYAKAKDNEGHESVLDLGTYYMSDECDD